MSAEEGIKADHVQEGAPESKHPPRRPTQAELHTWRHNSIAHFMNSTFKALFEREGIEWKNLKHTQQQHIAKHMNKLITAVAHVSKREPVMPEGVERKPLPDDTSPPQETNVERGEKVKT